MVICGSACHNVVDIDALGVPWVSKGSSHINGVAQGTATCSRSRSVEKACHFCPQLHGLVVREICGFPHEERRAVGTMYVRKEDMYVPRCGSGRHPHHGCVTVIFALEASARDRRAVGILIHGAPRVQPIEACCLTFWIERALPGAIRYRE